MKGTQFITGLVFSISTLFTASSLAAPTEEKDMRYYDVEIVIIEKTQATGKAL